MIYRVKSKLQNNRGESIAEVLVALLVSSIAIMMLATAITTSTKMLDSSLTQTENYYNGNNRLSGQTSTQGTMISLETKDTSLPVTASSSSISVHYDINNTISNKPVINYWIVKP